MASIRALTQAAIVRQESIGFKSLMFELRRATNNPKLDDADVRSELQELIAAGSIVQIDEGRSVRYAAAVARQGEPTISPVADDDPLDVWAAALASNLKRQLHTLTDDLRQRLAAATQERDAAVQLAEEAERRAASAEAKLAQIQRRLTSLIMGEEAP